MGLAAAALMIFVPCRPIALIRNDPRTAKYDPDGKSITVMAQEKMDFGRGRTMLVLRDIPDPAFSPMRHFISLHDRARRLNCEEALFCSERGFPYKRPDVISKALKALLAAAGIPNVYLPYSIRHALINELYAAGLDEKQVNAYTGHSHNYHTTLEFYYHLDKQWVGNQLAAQANTLPETVKLTERVIHTILADEAADGAENFEI
jgi:site-specific recombinase XerC